VGNGFTSEINPLLGRTLQILTSITFSSLLLSVHQKPVCEKQIETARTLCLTTPFVEEESQRHFRLDIMNSLSPVGKIQGLNPSPPSALIYIPIEMVQLSCHGSAEPAVSCPGQ